MSSTWTIVTSKETLTFSLEAAASAGARDRGIDSGSGCSLLRPPQAGRCVERMPGPTHHLGRSCTSECGPGRWGSILESPTSTFDLGPLHTVSSSPTAPFRPRLPPDPASLCTQV